MKRSKFSEAQIAFILRQGDEGTAIGEVRRKAGIGEATYYNGADAIRGKRQAEEDRCGSVARQEMLQDVIRRKL